MRKSEIFATIPQNTRIGRLSFERQPYVVSGVRGEIEQNQASHMKSRNDDKVRNDRKMLIWFLIGLLVAIIPWLVIAARM
jgi:predicted nucleic acid-binding Zn ribbon protein